jgi:hypothetical protein
MKNRTKLLFMSAVAATLVLQAQTSNAGEILRSPRDASSRHRTTTVSAANDPDLLKRYTGNYVFSPRFIDNLPSISLRSANEGLDVARAPRPNLSPKDPRFEMAWRANALKQVQVAPLK